MLLPIPIVLFFFGLLIGSFLNVVILRTRSKTTAVKGRSACPHCQEQLHWYENIPLLSFLIQKGHCRHCEEPISWQYPSIELMTAMLFTVTGALHGTDYLLLVRDLFLVSTLIVVFVYDLRWQEIWDRFSTIPAAFLFAYQWLVLGMDPLSMLLGVLLIAGFFTLQFVVSKGRWIGGGDIRLGVLMGVVLGWQLGLLSLLVAYVLGAVIGVILIATNRKKRDDMIPFGTFLSVATLVALWYGNAMIGWYMSLF